MTTVNVNKVTLSEDGRYCYSIFRKWDTEKPQLLFILVSPGKVINGRESPEIKKCVFYAKAWGFGGVTITYLYPFITPDIHFLSVIKDPVGENQFDFIKGHDTKVAAWGDYLPNTSAVNSLVKAVGKLSCIEVTTRGYPVNPLFTSKKAKLKPYSHRF